MAYVYVSKDVVSFLVWRMEHDPHTNANTVSHNTIYDSFKFSCSVTSSKVLVEAAHCEGSFWNATQLIIRAGSAKENTSATNPYKNVWFCINPGLVPPFCFGSSAILSPFPLSVTLSYKSAPKKRKKEKNWLNAEVRSAS